MYMTVFEKLNIPSLAVLAVIAVLIIAAVFFILRKSKKKSACGGNCEGCSSQCANRKSDIPEDDRIKTDFHIGD